MEKTISAGVTMLVITYFGISIINGAIKAKRKYDLKKLIHYGDIKSEKA